MTVVREFKASIGLLYPFAPETSSTLVKTIVIRQPSLVYRNGK